MERTKPFGLVDLASEGGFALLDRMFTSGRWTVRAPPHLLPNYFLNLHQPLATKYFTIAWREISFISSPWNGTASFAQYTARHEER
jgi:hypothetical protein